MMLFPIDSSQILPFAKIREEAKLGIYLVVIHG
jgi:hypothetical protein